VCVCTKVNVKITQKVVDEICSASKDRLDVEQPADRRDSPGSLILGARHIYRPRPTLVCCFGHRALKFWDLYLTGETLCGVDCPPKRTGNRYVAVESGICGLRSTV